MGVFHVFKIIQMVPNHGKYDIWFLPRLKCLLLKKFEMTTNTESLFSLQLTYTAITYLNTTFEDRFIRQGIVGYCWSSGYKCWWAMESVTIYDTFKIPIKITVVCLKIENTVSIFEELLDYMILIFSLLCHCCCKFS